MALPYKEEKQGKKEQVAQMFNNISGSYDFLNHFLSGGIDIYWRRKAISYLKASQPKLILDVATGTADFAIEALKISPDQIIGIDISEGMLAIGREKIKKYGLEDKIILQSGDSEKIEYKDNFFDAVIVSFGVRNFENLQKGLSEINRVLKPEGTLVILEFSKPTGFPVKNFYNLYFRFILPFIGKLISKDNAAYTYLPESVEEFPYGENFVKILKTVGFKSTKWVKLTFGISSLYISTK